MSNSRACSSALLLLAPLSGILPQESASSRLVTNGAVDSVLPWQIHRFAEVGRNETGPSTFFRVFPWTVVADARGRFYVLDVGDHRVAVFDSAANHIRDMGAQGGGPGEFLRPVAVAVSREGNVIVADVGKGALVRFDSTSHVLEQLPLPHKPVVAIADWPGGLLVGEGPSSFDQLRVALIDDSVRTVLAEVGGPGPVPLVSYPGCRMRVPSRPLFEPGLTWAAAGSTLVWNEVAEYRLVVWHNGRPALTVTRDLAPAEISYDEALRDRAVRNGISIRWSGGSCKVSPRQYLEARGFARQRSVVEGIAISPDKGFWVRREAAGGERGTDVFARDGRYVGTLPRGVPFPSAFLSPDLFVALEATTDGVPVVVVWQIDRG